MITPRREPDAERAAEDDALSAVLTGILGAGTAYDVVQGLLDALCTHAAWDGAEYWTRETEPPGRVSLFAISGPLDSTRSGRPRQPSAPVRQAFTTADLVMDPITDALLALPLVHEERVVGVVAPAGPPPIVTQRRAEVLRYLASRSASALCRRADSDTLSAQVASVQRDLAVLTAVVRAGQEGRPPRQVALENASLDELGRHVVALVGRLNGQESDAVSPPR